MAPPTDREFERVLKKLDELDGKLDRLAEENAKRAGAEAAVKWALGGGIAGIIALIGTIWQTVWGG